SRVQILRIFLIQGGLLGFAGALVGSVMGAAALIVWHRLARQVDGSELFPLVIEPSLFIAAAALASLTGVAAGIGPRCGRPPSTGPRPAGSPSQARTPPR